MARSGRLNPRHRIVTVLVDWADDVCLVFVTHDVVNPEQESGQNTDNLDRRHPPKLTNKVDKLMFEAPVGRKTSDWVP